jgi:hypothetical protein
MEQITKMVKKFKIGKDIGLLATEQDSIILDGTPRRFMLFVYTTRN